MMNFKESRHTPTPKTPRTPVAGVLGVPPDGVLHSNAGVSGVLGAPPPWDSANSSVSESRHTPTPKTPRTPVAGVLGVPPQRYSDKSKQWVLAFVGADMVPFPSVVEASKQQGISPTALDSIVKDYLIVHEVRMTGIRYVKAPRRK